MPTKPKLSTAQKPTSVQDWKADRTIILTVPSGHQALVRNPGMRAFLTAGLIPNSLMPFVTEALDRGQPPSVGAFKEKLAQDANMVTEMFAAVDAVTIYCVIEPAVRSDLWHHSDEIPEGQYVGEKIPPQLRDPDVLYVDDVDDNDKMFIFNWAVGGTRDLEQFRQQTEQGVETLQHGEDVVMQAK